MKKVTRHVRDLADADRDALERVIGESLDEGAQVTINVVGQRATERGADQGGNGSSTTGQSAWWSNIYEGLNDDEVDRLDAAIRQRANLARTFG